MISTSRRDYTYQISNPTLENGMGSPKKSHLIGMGLGGQLVIP